MNLSCSHQSLLFHLKERKMGGGICVSTRKIGSPEWNRTPAPTCVSSKVFQLSAKADHSLFHTPKKRRS